VRRLPAAEQPSWAGPWQPVTSVSAVISIGSHDVQMVRHAHATRAAEFQVAGSSCSRAEQTHPMRIARRVPRLAASPAGANRPAEAARCLEACAHLGRALTIRNMMNSAIPFGAHSRPMPMRDQCQLAAARLRCEPRSHAVDWTGEVGCDG
jgi:hypothetical protein